MSMIAAFFARRRAATEARLRADFAAELDRRHALVENDQTLSRFEREAVADFAPNWPKVREYMIRHRTWVPPYWAFNPTSPCLSPDSQTQAPQPPADHPRS